MSFYGECYGCRALLNMYDLQGAMASFPVSQMQQLCGSQAQFMDSPSMHYCERCRANGFDRPQMGFAQFEQQREAPENKPQPRSFWRRFVASVLP